MIGGRYVLRVFGLRRAVGMIDFTGIILVVCVVGVAGVLAVTLTLIFPGDAQLVGVLGIFDFRFLLFGKTGHLAGVAGLFVSLGLIGLGLIRGRDVRLKNRSDNIFRYAAHNLTPDNSA